MSVILRGIENAFKVVRDFAAMMIELGAQVGIVGAAHRRGDQRLVVAGVRKPLGLLVVQILQPVFELAQKYIGIGKLPYRSVRKQIARCEQRKYGKCRRSAQRGIASAAD